MRVDIGSCELWVVSCLLSVINSAASTPPACQRKGPYKAGRLSMTARVTLSGVEGRVVEFYIFN